jgi:hypothetical protein
MLIIPLSGKISKKNPPLITIAIIVINTLVYLSSREEMQKNIKRRLNTTSNLD